MVVVLEQVVEAPLKAEAVAVVVVVVRELMVL
jgi:hypothetical protein